MGIRGLKFTSSKVMSSEKEQPEMGEKGNKKRQTEHRTATTAYPCYLPVLGEFSRSWSCRLARPQI